MLLQDQNQGVLLGKLGQYYYFTIVEIVFIGILCVIQVECIKKMLDHSVVIWLYVSIIIPAFIY